MIKEKFKLGTKENNKREDTKRIMCTQIINLVTYNKKETIICTDYDL